jgi:hypothetical protein
MLDEWASNSTEALSPKVAELIKTILYVKGV